MTFNDLVKIGLKLKDVEESMAWGTPALKRKKRFMGRLKEDGDLVLKMDWENHDRLLRDRPDAFYKTDHYDGYPALLVRMELLDPSLAKEIIELSWADALNPARTIKTSP